MDTSSRLRSRGRPRRVPSQEEPPVVQKSSFMEHHQPASPSQAASELDFAMDDDNSAGDPFGFGSLVSPILSFPFAKTNQMQLKYKANLVGEKILNPAIYLCDLCNLPIIIYGRMIPCKHVFCYTCAKKADKVCLRCADEIFKIEKCNLGTVFMCRTESCKRTYLSQRDLEAHIKHRHVRKTDLSNRF